MSTKKTVVIAECDHDAFDEENAAANKGNVKLKIEQATADNLVEKCFGADGILVQYGQITAEVMDQLPNLKAIGRYGVGVDSVDVAAATERGIVVCNVPDYGTEAVSDHAVAMALAVARGLVTLNDQVRSGTVDLSQVRPLHQVKDRIFGVVGLGRIGLATARKAAGLGYRVVGWEKLSTPGSVWQGVETVSLEELLRISQVVSLHIPLSEENRHIIGEAELAIMRSDAIIVNTARGGLIAMDPLVAALQERRLAGAAIDCHEIEPLPADHPLVSLPNVVLSPHFAWYSEESYGELKRRTAEGVIDVVNGIEPQNPVNPEVLANLDLEKRKELS